MAYASWSVVFGEQPSAAKWNILGTNDSTFNASLTLSGMAVQTKSTNFSAVNSGSTVLPRDDTIPQITEGNEYMTQAITPTIATNILLIQATAHASSSAAGQSMSIALFQDATANALAANGEYADTATASVTLALVHRMVAGTTSSTTFRIRVGGTAAGTTTFNGAGAARLYGGITQSNISVTELIV